MNMQIGDSTAVFSSRSYPYFHLSQYGGRRFAVGTDTMGGIDAFFERVSFLTTHRHLLLRLGVTITADAQVICHPKDFDFIQSLMEASCVSDGSSKGTHDEEH